MSEIGRQHLFGKLNPTLHQSLESAVAFARLRGNPYVELVHWLHQTLQLADSDLHRIAARFGLDTARISSDMLAALDQLPGGAGSISDLSEHIDHAVERGWTLASLRYDAARIRSGHLLVGLVKTYALRNVLLGMSRQFAAIVPDVLLEELETIVGGSPESPATGTPATSSGETPRAPPDSALAQYAVDLTAQAREGGIDPVTGRDAEIRQMVDILMRRRQNNPLLTGDAGVGKTAVVEGLALRLAEGDVPPPLRGVQLYLLDIGLLQAGASVKGEFESRLRAVIDEVQASPHPCVLFIDEIHALVGAGGPAGTGDAANLLKPALARGQLRTIGATTWSEYKKYIEKDPALTRRFQVIQVHEPGLEQAVGMLRGLAGKLAEHHGVLLLDEAIQAAVSLSQRYIPARQLPDKGVALLDTACARVAVSQHATPPALEDVQRRIASLELESGIARREAALGLGTPQRLEALAADMSRLRTEEQVLTNRWSAEKEALARILALREQLSNPELPALDGDSLRARLTEAQAKLAQAQADAPLVLPAVDAQAVRAVVAAWTGIPVGRMRHEAPAVLQLTDTLSHRVVGQRHALEAIARRIQTSRAGLTDPNKPVGVFLLCGPSGVGKTESALALAEALYGGEQNLITINMSEFQEAHTVATLKGAPPGYVGYGEGGVLTEAVRRRPYSVVLLDEVEKAHPDVHEIFFQVFDKGWMEDGEGRRIDFRHTVIMLTSNVGTERIGALCSDPELMPDADSLTGALRDPLRKVFPAALLGRLVAIPYYPLSDDMLAQIVELQIARVRERLAQAHGAELDVTPQATRMIVARCTELESGGRMVDAVMTGAILPPISQAVLNGAGSGRPVLKVTVDVAEDDFLFTFD